MKNPTTSTTRIRRFVTTMLMLTGALFLFAVTAQASTYAVTNTNDTGAGSLRQAVTNANANPYSVIHFNIPGAGVHTILLNSQLVLEQPVTIDGYSQPGASVNTQVEGSNALPLIELKSASPVSNTALMINVGDCVIRGLVINNFDVAILIDGTVPVGADHTTITGCFIGTNAAGNLAAPNTHGIIVSGSSDNIIGGVTLSSRNLISGNTQAGIYMASQNGKDAKHNLIAGNLIGTDKSGSGAIANAFGIFLYQVTGPNTIGAAPPLARNVISGNVIAGIDLSATNDTLIIGNYLGTNASGTGKVGNGWGVFLEGLSVGNKIGTPGAGNLISGNKTDGIRLGNCKGDFCPFDNQVAGNLIGTKADGSSALGNTETGIFMEEAGTIKNTIGGTASDNANVIAFNGAGVASSAGKGNAILRNSIFSNTGPGIDLKGITGPSPNDLNDPDSGPNNLQNFPVVSSAFSSNGITTMIGTLNSEDSKSYRIEFFINSQCHGSGFGEGKTFVAAANVTTNGNNAGFNVSFPGFNLNQFVTATATDPNGNTSEFSPCKQVQAGLPGSLAFSAANYSVAENGGVASLTVLRTGGSTGAVSIQYASGSGTATPSVDYTPVSGTLSWADGDSAAKIITIPLINDQLDEVDESVGIILSNATGGAALGGQNSSVLTITDDDPLPSVSISDVSIAEGDSGTTPAVFKITMSAPSGKLATVFFATLAGTATNFTDYQQINGDFVNFNPGETTKTITVGIFGDTTVEPDETFSVNLFNPINATVDKAEGRATILNDDAPLPAGSLQFSTSAYNVTENGGQATITVTRKGGSSGAVSMQYATAPGTATVGSDYTAANGTLNWADGDVSDKTFTVALNDDALNEADETVNLSLSSPTGNASLGNPSTATLTIGDNDSQPSLSISDVSQTEGNSGTASLVFDVTMSTASSQTVTVDFATAGGTATSVGDYQPVSGTLTFNPGETSKAITVMVNGDTTNEPDETFFVNLSNPGNAAIARAQGAGTIKNDDPPPPEGSLEFSANSYSVNENGGAATVTVKRTGGSNGAVSVQYATTDGTAVNSDYTSVSGTLNWAAGDSSDKTFSVAILEDALNEAGETVNLSLSNPAGGATLGNQNTAVLTIADNDSQPGLSISDVSLAEGNNGATPFNFNVTLSAASGQVITVDYATADGTALAGDYQSAAGTLTFKPGETSKTIAVLVTGDVSDEPHETFAVSLSNITNAVAMKTSGAGTIINDDAAVKQPTFDFSQANYGVAEQLGAVTVTVVRSGDTGAAASVDYATGDGPATQKGDFEITAGTLNFAPGEASKTIQVLLNQDSYAEGPESFNLVLSNPTGAVLGQPITTVNITDNVPESLTNPIDDAQSFVHMHYHDFLNREPDQAGLQFWTNQIASCGSDAACIISKRTNVSAAFFLSIEFQRTGYLLHLFQKESFASLPKYAAFMSDLQEVSRGVVVNSPDWEQKLAANQQAFAEKWVNRPEFKAVYDGMSNPAFVNALYANAGIVPPQDERAKLVTALDSATQTRAAVLLEVAGNAVYKQQEQNAAFVLMQYFGYLRRDPNSAPDSDLSGYYFWLNKLNSFNGDYQQAEMVKAFLLSTEYRGRFGNP